MDEKKIKIKVAVIEQYLKKHANEINSVGDKAMIPETIDQLKVNELYVQRIKYNKEVAESLTEVSIKSIRNTFPCWVDLTEKGINWIKELIQKHKV